MGFDLEISSTWHESGRRKVAGARALQEGDDAALCSLVDTWLTYRGKRGARTSEKTRRAYGVGVRDWLRYCWPDRGSSPELSVLRADSDDVRRWLAVSAERLSPASVQLYLSAVRALYEGLAWANLVSANPTLGVSAPHDPRPRHERRELVALGDYRLLLDAAADDPLDTLLLRLLGDQGLRNAEVRALLVDDVDMRSGVLVVRSGKGGKRRTVPLTRPTRSAVSAWLPLRPGGSSPHLLVNPEQLRSSHVGEPLSSVGVRRRLRALSESAGVPYLGAHSLRHTAGTRLYQATGDLYRVSQVLGHSDVNTSSIYAKMDLSGLRDVLASLDDV